MLHRIMHRFCEVIFGDLHVVSGDNLGAVDDPGTNNLPRESFGQFRPFQTKASERFEQHIRG